MPKETRRESFEQLYARLESAVAKLETGGLPLEAAIDLYEQGMMLARQCQERLDAAELKITKLRETFASVPARSNGTAEGGPQDDYEYVAEDDGAAEDDPFP
jgi:exodeoxyribonuclease VII small subunit